MKRKLFFMTLLMLFCSVMFGQRTNNWVMDDSPFDENMSLTCQIKINDEFYLDENVTVGAFIEDDLRGVAKPTKDGDRYVVYMTIHGESSDGNSQAITFRLRHPDYEYDMTTTYSLSYVTGKTEGSYDNPIVIDFYPNKWNDLDVKDSCESTMVAFYEISIDGEKQERSNIELAVFCGDELRGWARPSKSDFHNDKYVAAIYIYGNELDDGDEMLSFKLYDSKADKVLETSYQLRFVANEFIGMESPETIDFRNEAVAQVGNTYYTTLEAALKALTENATLTILEDITISSDWDCRNTGAKITVPVTINGNGKTIEFTGKINDGYNHLAAFRFEAPVTVNNLTVDMSEAISEWEPRLRAISTSASLTVSGSTFIGNSSYNNTRAIIFGEGAGANVGNLTISITNSIFKNWRRGIGDNENAQDVKSVTITDNTFENANVSVSAYEKVTFTGNNMSSNSYVNITSHTVPNEVAVTATGNTNLAANTETEYNQIVAPTIVAQDGFLTPVAEAGGKYYMTLQGAVDAAKSNETVITMIDNVSITETVKVSAGQNITLDLNGKTIDGTENVRIAIMSYGNLTIKDSTAEKNGTIKAGIGTAGNTINVCAGTFTFESGNIYSKNNAILIDEEAAIVNIKGGTITAEPNTNNSAAFYIPSTSETTLNITAGTMKGYNGILLWNNTEINITGGSIEATGSVAIQGNGTCDNTLINIGGEETSVKGYYAAIYHPQNGELNIANGTLEGWTGVVVKSGKVTISGGTINGIGTANEYRPVSSGFVDTGDALYVEHYDNSTNSENYGTPTVTVTGGTFNSTNAQAVASYANTNNNVEAIAKFISGGTFDNPIAEAYCAEGYIPADLGNGKYGVKQGTFVARVNGVGYETVTAAIAAAQAGETVQLLPGEISEYIAPWANDTQHTTEKSITIIGAENFGTTLTGGLYLGYDDSQCREHNIVVKGINFTGKGILVAGQKNVVIENNKFSNITDNVASPGSANANAISVIGKNINATVTGNVIDGTASAGINLRDTKTVNVISNTVTNTVHNSITVQNNTTAEGDIVAIKDNTLSNWGTGVEGRAVRIAGGAEANVNGNVMSCATAPEEFVKVTGSTTLDASANYWDGYSPLSGNYFLSDLAADPVSILKSYYTDAAKSNLVQLSASVAKIGTTYYQTINAAIAAAQAGETVTILAGDYEQNLNINKEAITVVGERGDNGEYVVYLKGKVSVSGANITVKNLSVFNGGGNAMGISGGNILVENCELTGANALRSCYANDGDVTLRNCAITGGTYGVHFDAGNGDGDVVIEGCTIKGWTSFGKAIEEVRISNTDFLNGNYNQLRFYQNSQMTNCKFNEEMTIDFGMNDVNAEFEGCAVVDTEGNETDAPLTNVIYLGDIAEMGVDVTINSEPVIVEAKVADNNGDKASYFLLLQAALNAATSGQTVTVLQDITLEQTATIAAGKVVTLDLNGKTINAGWEDQSAGKHIYAFTNNGTLTIKDSSAEANGTINARGNYNYGTLTLEKGTINAIDDNGGYGVRNYDGATFTMNGGTIAATNEDGDAPGVTGAYDATTVRVDEGATFTMNGGTINNSCNYTFAIDNYGTTTIKGGTITSVHSTVANYGTMTIEGGSFTCNGLEGITAHALWAAAGTTTINGGTFDGKDNYNGFNVDASEGAIVNITGGKFLPVHSGSLYGEGTIAVSGGIFFDDVTEFCAFNYVCTKNSDGTYGVQYKPQEDNAFVISTLHELIAFRNAVNAGNTFEGQTVVLSGDVKLASTRAAENWIPIGTNENPFLGTFDGGNFKIFNLTIDDEDASDLGLFGRFNAPAVIKNINIENVNIKGQSNIGAVVGNGYTGTIDNCHVTGIIKLEGNYKVGGISGQGYAKINKSSVIATKDSGSYVKASYSKPDLEGDNVGGIVGHTGEGKRDYKNNTVKNILVSGTRKVGGIAGIMHQTANFENNTVENVTVETTATTDYANSKLSTMSIGALIGQYYPAGSTNDGTVKECVVKNVEFSNVNGVTVDVGPIVGGARGGTNGMLAPSTDIVSEGNLVYMSTITGSNNLYLMDPVAKIGTTEYYTLFDAVAAVQDGETTITMLRSTAEEFAIDNTTANITLDMAGFTLTGAITPSKANLTINGGTINNTNSGYSAIEINAGTLVLNDVKVTSKRHGVRIDGAVTATINGGEYTLTATSGTRHAVNVSGGAEVTITAGTFEGPKGTTMDSGSAVCVQKNSKVTIEGGDFSKGKNYTLSAAGTLIVKGGKFDQDPSAYLAPGYVAVKNGNVWTVGLGVAKLNGVTYVSLQAAIDAAVVGDNAIQLLANIDGDVTILQQEGINIVIDGKKNDTENYTFNGTINIYGNARNTGTETLKIQNVNFYTEDSGRYFIEANEIGQISGTNNFKQYAHNVTVENCNFATSAGNTNNTVVGMRFRQAYNMSAVNCTSDGIFSIMWTTAVEGLTLNKVVATNCKEGITIGGASKKVNITNTQIESNTYAIRAEGAGSDFTIKDSTLEAKVPVVVRSVTDNSKLSFTFSETNVITESNPTSYWFVAGAGAAYQGNENEQLPVIKGQVTVVLNDTGLSYDGVYGNYGVAKIGDVVYTTFNDAYNAATENNNVITLLADAVVKQTVAKPITINGNEKQLAGNMLVTSDVTFGGKLGLTNNVKVTNGATLTIAEGAEVTGAGTFFGAGSDNNYYGMTNSVTAAGTIKINGNVDIQQINANNAGVVTVAEGAKLTVDIVCAENGDMQNAVAGVMNISGNVETQRFNIFGGSTVNVNATGVVSSEQMFTSSNIEDVISIWGGAKLVVIGTVTCATIEHTDARHSKVNIGADGTLVVDKGGRFTCGGELKNAGELKVVLDCTAEVQSLTGNGKVTVDATYMTASEGLAVKADVTNFNGEITVVGGSYEKTSEGIYVRRTTEFFYTAAGVETTQDQAAYSLMFTITDNANKEVSVKIGSMKPANNSNAHLVIPATVAFNGVNETFKVTAIEDNAFNSCRNFVGDLTLPQYVRTIGDRAFNTCHYITNPEHPKGKLTLNEGLISIGSQAFTNSYFTDGLSIPRSVTMIEPNAFQYAKIKGALTINSDVECALAFNSSEFTKVEIAEGVEEICANAFNGMVNVTEVVLPSTLKEIGLAAFGSDNAIETIWSNAAVAPTILWQSNIESNKHPFTQTVRDNAVVFVTTNYKNYTEAEKWKEFDNIYGLYPIQKTGYSLLVKVNDNVCSVEIGDKPHQNDRIELELPRTIEYYGEVRAVTSIAKGGFKSCPFFGTLTIPGNIETIADNAFNTCMQFNKLVIEEGVKTIGNGSFSMCSGVDYISFPSTLESIGQNAFNVVYMENGGRIVSFAVNPPTAYKHIYNQGINPVNPSFPQNLRNNAILYVFEESLDKYKSATGWEFIDVRPIEAKIGETYYLTLTEAIAAATSGQTITLLADVKAADGTPVTIPAGVTLDINTHNVTANIYGTVKTSGGLWTTVTVPGFNSREMLGNGAIYNTNNATVANSANEVKMLAGSIVLNPNPETEWWTLPNQDLSIASGASFEVPANIKFTVRENTHVVVNGILTVNGVVYLQKDATVEAAAGLNILTDVEGYMVSYEDGVYSVVQAIYTQTTQLIEGWNWFSYYVETDLAELQDALGTNGVQIKNQLAKFSEYLDGWGWDGNLQTLSETQMYMINTSMPCNVKLSGKLMENIEITLANEGWTWIGFPMDEEVPLSVALSGIPAKTGDVIKTQYSSAEYLEGWGWDGTLKKLVPGEGYMYYSSNESPITFVYSPNSDKSELRANITADNNHWIPNAGQYANNMTMTAMVNVEGNYEIAAFVNGEVRGSARPIYVEALDSYIYFLTIHGDEVEEMSFRLYDLDTDIEYNLSDRMNYSDNAMVGSLTEPYMFNLEMLGIGENSAESFNIYPNPTTTNAEINLNATCDKVEVFNALGVKIAEYSNVDSIDAVETAGIYVIRVTDNGNVQHCRLIVK